MALKSPIRMPIARHITMGVTPITVGTLTTVTRAILTIMAIPIMGIRITPVTTAIRGGRTILLTTGRHSILPLAALIISITLGMTDISMDTTGIFIVVGIPQTATDHMEHARFL